MAARVWNGLLAFSRCKKLQHMSMSIYTKAEEKAAKETLRRFAGGSIHLSLADNGIGVLTLNNPRRLNAMTGTMIIELHDRVKELEVWTEGKGLIVHGAENTFCSGTDVSALHKMSAQEAAMASTFMQNTLTGLVRLPLISVALIQGKALGSGAELSTAFDFRLMAPDSEIQFVHKHMGVTPAWGGAARLVQIIGARKSLQLYITGQKVDPAHALQIGLTDAVLLSKDGSLEEAHGWLNQYTEGPAAIIQALKNAVVSAKEQQLVDALRTEKDIFGAMWDFPAHSQSLAAARKFR